MHDIQFKLEDVQRFHLGTRAIGREIAAAQTALKKSLADVSPYWKDESITIAQRDIAEIDRKIREALMQLDKTIDTTLRRQIDWANRYRSIR